jgi:hypothetical protein
MQARKAGAVSPPAVCLERGRLMHRRTLSKQNLQGQVSAKLTPEICINNTSRNNRLTAAGRQPQPQIAIHRPVSRHFFFPSLPTFDEKTTELHLHAEKLTETVLHLNLGHFVGFFFFVQFCSTLCEPFDETTTEQI